ncbi:hypothetical protein [Mucilaginibacter gossypii]|uniref:Uncharacterized protein n=1 Tax=Mucilaginibacter gossypii TaxID=551996 RepID=A0A1G8CWW3_9SPHI|nr:hypothetical protein [Mucilaginibacter gossypii]SDH49599.1 hypothetical protein SAMN05192573_11054 [Mucilaginibacter gossypii]
MDEQSNSNQPPSFTTLTDIMERFQTVPYDQFQQELQSWFEQSLAKQKGLNNAEELQQCPDLQQLLALVAKIYHRAEVSQTLSDHQITQSHDQE